MVKPILTGMTRAEAQRAARRAQHRHPAVGVAVRLMPAEAEHDDRPVFELVVEKDDFERYRDVVDSIAADVRPDRLRLALREKDLAGLVREMLVTGSFSCDQRENKLLERLCLTLEYQVVPLVSPLGDFVDGFLPNSVQPRPSGLALAGRCWCFTPNGGQVQDAFEGSGTRTDHAARRISAV